MKITLINGNMRHGSTWHVSDLVIAALGHHGEQQITEFCLPRDLPHFCNGCYSCFLHGEQTCPHAEYVKPIVDSLLASDLIVLTSPVYGLDVTGQMKAFIDHLCYLWISHRPEEAMFQKLGLVISTTAGIGAVRTSKTMQLCLKYWGIPKIYTLASAVSAMSWEDIPAPKRAMLEKKARAIASRILRAQEHPGLLRKPLFRSLLFSLMAASQKKNGWNPTDRKHWEKRGWLDGVRPF